MPKIIRRVPKGRVTRRKKTVRKPTYKRPKMLSMTKEPFPNIMTTKLIYQGEFGDVVSSGVSAISYTQWRPNDLYDFDITGNFNNKQPLYYDQLLSNTGPYKRYCVYAWKTTLTVFNTSDIPLELFVDTNTINSVSDADTVTEIANRKGVIKRVLTAQANAKPYTTISWYKTLKSLVPDARASINEWGGYYTGSPNNYVCNTLLARSINLVAGHTYRCKVTHTYYVKLFELDATQS